MKSLLLIAFFTSLNSYAEIINIPGVENSIGIYNGKSTEKGWFGIPHAVDCQVRISKNKQSIIKVELFNNVAENNTSTATAIVSNDGHSLVTTTENSVEFKYQSSDEFTYKKDVTLFFQSGNLVQLIDIDQAAIFTDTFNCHNLIKTNLTGRPVYDTNKNLTNYRCSCLDSNGQKIMFHGVDPKYGPYYSADWLLDAAKGTPESFQGTSCGYPQLGMFECLE